MPELPEVEQFRRFLLPLVSSTNDPLRLSLVPDTVPPRVWLSASDIDTLNDGYSCTDVLRKGKQLCLVLEKRNATQYYLFLHMGMTGSIRSPGRPIGWGHEARIEESSKDGEACALFPPKYAYLILQTSKYKAAFCDPRKFGKAEVRTDSTPLNELAADAWQGPAPIIAEKLTNQSTGIKALLLDQKRACAGVGNWVADEVLYQCRMHPDQSYLTAYEAAALVQVLQSILGTAVDCLARHVPYPSDWLFPYRWTKKKAGKDSQGRSIVFVTSGGRTTALIASQQKLYKRKRDDGANSNGQTKQPSKKRPKTDATKKAIKVETTADEYTNRGSTGRDKPSKAKQSSSERRVAPSQRKAAATPPDKSRRQSPRLITPSSS